MKLFSFINMDVIFTSVIITVTASASTILYQDFTKKIEHSGTKQIGTITFKKKIAERKYSGRMIWEPVTQSAPLYNYDSIRTEEDSVSIVKLNDGSEIELDENTLIVLNMTDKGSSIDFSKGAIFAKKTAGKALSIQASGTTIAIDKGDVNLSKQKDASLNLNVASGMAQVKSGNVTKQVATNQVASISKKGAEVKKNTLILKSPGTSQYFLSFAQKKNISFSWDMEKKEKIYLEISSSRSFGTLAHRSSPGGTSRTVSLNAGKYYWRVRSAKGAQSETRRFSIQKDKVAYPIAPARNAEFAFVAARPMISFKWTAGELASSYTVEIATDPNFKNITKTLRSRFPGISTDQVDAGVYYWRVKNSYAFGGLLAENAGPASKFKILKKKTITPPVLIYPANNEKISSLLFKSGNKLVFNWKLSDDIREYRFLLAREKTFKEPLVNSATRNNYFPLSGELQPGTYYWKVSGVAPDGSAVPPARPRKLQISSFEKIVTITPANKAGISPFSDQGRVSFTWKDPNRGSSYLLEIASDNKFTKILHSVPAPGTTVTVKNLKGGKFFWRVSLTDKKKTRLITSNIASASMKGLLADPEIIAPASGGIVDMTHKDNVAFSWKKVPEATHYRFRLFQVKGGGRTQVLEKEVQSTNINFTNLRHFDVGDFHWEIQALQYTGNKLTSKSNSKKNLFTIKLEVEIGAPEFTPTDIYIE
ncbi:MAG: hypothetical protein GY754_08700 [bacterium]|nr:hypothetical protein [bacterium]